MIKFAIPKGSLEEATFKFLEQAWFSVHGKGRSYRVRVNDPEIYMKLVRPQEIPTFVSTGMYDIGITGKDWVTETNADVKVILNLEYGYVRLVYAIPKDMPYSSLAEMIEDYHSKGKVLRISTEYLNLASNYIKSNAKYREIYGSSEPMVITPWFKNSSNDRVQIILSFGATEAKPPDDTDAIIDITETGSTLEQNNLKPIEVIMESTAMLVANKNSLNNASKREKIYDVLTLLKGVVDGRKKLHIFMNVNSKNLNELLACLPALKRPTVSNLSEEGWYAVNTVISKDEFVTLLPTLRRLAQGIVVHEPRQILPLEEIMKDEQDRG